MEELTVDINAKAEVKILAVDDREDNLLSIETILEKSGYTIRTANSGRAALRTLLKESDFTLILMDVQMPDLNGFETATLIYERDKLKHIPIIFITANDHAEDSVFKSYQMGGVDYIYKPINADLLRAKVAVFVELFRKNHALMAQEQNMAAAYARLEREIKERISSEEKIKQLNRQLVENITNLKITNEQLERFAYVASHDLQEPLRKIMLFSGQLAVKYRAILKDEGNDFIDRILKSSDRMRMLIKNILTFSRSADNEGSFEETDLEELLENVLSDLEVSIAQKNAVLDIGPLPKLKVVPGQMRQLFQNLVINALKFSREDCRPHISISAEKMRLPDPGEPDSFGDYYTIYVRDNGIGFEQKYADDIFGLFKRLNSYDKFEGTGIGLSICKKIVDLHKGYISAKSAVDEGATFIISLPIEEREVASLVAE